MAVGYTHSALWEIDLGDGVVEKGDDGLVFGKEGFVVDAFYFVMQQTFCGS